MAAARTAMLSVAWLCAMSPPTRAADQENPQPDMSAMTAASQDAAWQPRIGADPAWDDAGQQGGLRLQFDSGTLAGLHTLVNFWPSIHWLSSANMATTMASLGYTWRNLRLEGALIKGRDTERSRNAELIKLDSTARRLSYELAPNWSLQISRGYRDSPDQLAREAGVRRTTVSATYYGRVGDNPWHTTVAWRRSSAGPGYLMESAIRVARQHTLFSRIEHAGSDELFREEAGSQRGSYDAQKFTLGYSYDFYASGPARIGLGGLVSRRTIPAELASFYGPDKTSSMLFLRMQFQFAAR